MATEGAALGSLSTAPPPPPPPLKRRKIEPPRRNKPSQVAILKEKPSQVVLDTGATSSNFSVAGIPLARVDLNKVREAKMFAVFQAQHEGCLGSYKSFDSLFGNYLVPVIPSDDFLKQTAKE